VGDLQDCLLAAGAGDDPLGQPGVESVKDLAQAAVAVLPFCLETRGAQRLLNRRGGGFDTGRLIGDRSTSAVYLSTIPCKIRALPPPSTNPCSAATLRATAATSRWKSLNGITRL
jgi:hypothetical protein